MDNYFKKDSAISYAKEQGCFVKDIYLGMMPNGSLIWYGRGYRNALRIGEQETCFIIPEKEKIQYVDRAPKDIHPIHTDDVFLVDGVWCQYQHKTPIRYTRNQKGSDIIVTKSELLEKKYVEMLPYTSIPYKCYAVMEENKCINFIWGAGEPENFVHMVFALDTIKEFNPNVHTLRALKTDEYIRCSKAENGNFGYDHRGLFRVDVKLLGRVKNHQPINWL